MKVRNALSETALGIVLAAALTTPVFAVEVSLSCGAVGAELEHCKTGANAWAKETGNTVKIVTTPNSSSDRLAFYQQMLAGGSADVDVYQIDVIWPAILANHFIDLKPYAKGAEKDHFPTLIENNTVGGKLVAMPWFTDAGVLYYRKDLLEKYQVPVPSTWEDFTVEAKKIQDGERAAGNEKFWGFVFQGKAYEGLTCNALEWVDSFGGGTIIDNTGKVTINNPKAVKALETAAGWVGSIAPEGVLNYSEEEARGVWQVGNAAFMRSWPYAWKLGNAADSPIKDKIGVAPLPKGGADGKHSGTLGGWELAVSKYSKNPEAAASLVMYLTGPVEQKRRAIEGAYNPTIPSIYKDAEVQSTNPFTSSLYDTFTSAVARPSKATGSKYNKVSNEFWNTVHSVLSKQKPADKALGQLDDSLNRIMR
jgi:trehalose/maltose transport system substrate-binding protein